MILLLAPVVGAIRGCVVPIVRSLMSKLTPDDQQGDDECITDKIMK